MTRKDLKEWWGTTWALRRLALLLVGACLVRYSNWTGLGLVLCVLVAGEALLGSNWKRR